MTATSRRCRRARSAAFQLALILSTRSTSCVISASEADDGGGVSVADGGAAAQIDVEVDTDMPDRPWGSRVDPAAEDGADSGEHEPPPALSVDVDEGHQVGKVSKDMNIDLDCASNIDTASISKKEGAPKEGAQQQHQSAIFGAVKHGGEGHQPKREQGSDPAASGSNKGGAIPFVKPAKADNGGKNISSSTTSSDILKKGHAPAAAAIPKRNATARGGEGHHEPPEGYALAAHVVTDPRDGLSYFATEPGSAAFPSSSSSTIDPHLEIPYLECGYSGSTTPTIPLKSGHFRHLPPGAHPQTWTTATSTRAGNALLDAFTGGGGNGRRKDPQLLIALKPLELTVSGNGGESCSFNAGDCILLEDTVGKGHKLNPIAGEELSVLMLALPRHHHHHHHFHHTGDVERNEGKGEKQEEYDVKAPTILRSRPSPTSSSGRHLSVLGLRRRGVDRGRLPRPCRVPVVSDASADGNDGDSTAALFLDSSAGEMESVAAAILGDDIGRRRALLGTVGFGLSVFTTYFLYLVATPVLAVVGIATMFVGGAVLFDNFLGAAWTELGDLIGKMKEGSLGLEIDEDGDDAGGDAEDFIITGGGDEQENETDIDIDN